MNVPQVYASSAPLWAVLASLLAVPAILACTRAPNLREACTLIAAIAKLAIVLTLVPDALNGRAAAIELVEISPGITLALKADALGVFFALIASALWIVTSVYSIGYMRGNGEKKQTRFYASFALSLASTIGIAFSANLLTFLLFYELLTLATYPLVIHKESPGAVRAGRMYLAYALTAGLVFLAGTGWVYMATGSLDFKAGGMLASSGLDANSLRVLFCLFMVGVGVKSGIMPLHSWLPAAMVAPTPVSSLLHAVAVVKSGVFGILRVVGFIFGPELMAAARLDLILAVFCGSTILLASLIALRQDNLKRRLAYSTVGHLSYIGLGAALLTTTGFMGSALHLAAHALMKITLFFCAGAIYVHTHKTEISQLDGLGRAMPWTFGAFGIGALGLAGLPPLNGFVSKFYLCLGAMDAGQTAILAIYLISGLLNAAYFFPIVVRAFLSRDLKNEKYGEASAWVVTPLCLTAALAIAFGIFPDLIAPIFTLAEIIAAEIMQLAPS